ncbi:MAG: PatB family C-S lyase, partial [Anaerolineaceae bacterium]
VAARLQRRYSWKPELTQISYIPGVVTGVNLALRAICQPGEAVIVHTPAYPPFFSAPESANLKCIRNPLVMDAKGYYSIDFDRFEAQIHEEQVKAFILCNPQNPTGRVFTREELLKLAEICLRNRVTIISDEIHCDILFDQHRHLPIASLSPEIADCTITFMAPSKTFNMAGLYASVAIISNPELAERMNRVKRGIISGPELLALTAARAAYQYGDAWLEELVVYLQANRDWLAEVLPEKLPGVKFCKPEGTFLAWLDWSRVGLGMNPQQFLLQEARVGLNDGLEYGTEGEGFVRLNFGTQRAILAEAVERMSTALKNLKS